MSESINYFSATYEIARKRFLSAANAAGLPVQTFVHPVQDPLLAEAAVDVVRIGPKPAAKVLFVTSGVHGTELTAGSGAQLPLIEIFTKELPEDTAVVLVHAVNPVGCARLTRTDENNVDPNRNLPKSFATLPENTEYNSLHAALCPVDWEGSQAASDQAIADYVARKGDQTLIQDVLRGQHSHPDGLFFGGLEESWTVRNLTKIVKEHSEDASQLAIVDIHTGVGPYGFGEVMRMDRPAIAGAEWEKIGNLVCDVLDLAEAPLPPIKIILEFGTYTFDRVLTALRADNWLRHHGDVHTPLGRRIKADLRDALFADDPKWLDDVVRQTVACCHATLAEMQQNAEVKKA
ncbi:M14 family metallopeptidase [Lentibacter sp. XHP0401]|uniref:M14 family metallopeptidase n=1 Tax=Lentibacter sp. XHP0401 TaxID=2984334 RepID=UPI0021E887DC|nr:M14 family metallopeptidase [Lentibacter sp. XHP0401]MCV2892627.1 M14 family metallopeptidase [Lentibacter sp. XHP0401]